MFKIKMFVKLGIAASAVLIAGCATTSDLDSRYSPTEGWRKGVVTDVGSGPSFIEKLPKECRDDVSVKQSTQKFATVHYRYLSRGHWHTSPISNDSLLKVGDPVYINADTCIARIVSRHVPFEGSH